MVLILTLAVTAGLFALPIPWYASAALAVLLPYWFMPFVIYFTQKYPVGIPLRAVVPGYGELPAAQQRLEEMVTGLKDLGFAEVGRVKPLEDVLPQQMTVALLQHPQTTDLSMVFVAEQNGVQVGEGLLFSRSRTQGNWIHTACTTVHQPFPPRADDDAVTLPAMRPIEEMWALHQARVAADPYAGRNTTVTDVVAFQQEIERRDVSRHLASGYWRGAETDPFLRPTPQGALFMTWRSLPPWKQLMQRPHVKRAQEILSRSSSGGPAIQP